MKKLPKYVFRGTSEGFAGNETSKRNSVTSTSANPAKAALFAIVAANNSKKKGVIYIFDTEKLNAIPTNEGNCFSSYEEEIGFDVPPGKLQQLSLGYVYVEELIDELAENKIIVKNPIVPELLSYELKQINSLENGIIEKIVNGLTKTLK